MTTFFTSDLHFGHRLVAGLRGFLACPFDQCDGGPHAHEPDVEAHDATLIERWNKTVKPRDEVWVLGDITLRSPALVWHQVDALNGTRHLVIGNHDSCFAGNRGGHRHLRKYLEHFETVQPYATKRMEGMQVMLSHFPYTGDRGDDRCQQFRLRDYGAPVIHGHTHGPEGTTRTEQGTLQIHVGLDAHGLKPVSEAWVMNLLRQEGKTQ